MYPSSDPPEISGCTAVANLPGPLAIAQVWTRYEKRCAYDISAAGIPYYLPMLAVRWRSPCGKWRRENRLVMPGYIVLGSKLLAGGYADECTPSLAIEACGRKIVRLILAVNQDRLRRDLISMEKNLTAGYVRWEGLLELGAHVRVTAGALLGCEGVVMALDRERRVAKLGGALMGSITEVSTENLEVA